jgi:hypothetical protein
MGQSYVSNMAQLISFPAKLTLVILSSQAQNILTHIRDTTQNAGTLLSSQIRASPPDGKSFFKKTRSKKRCPFAEEEGRSLRTGYDERGVLWGQVVKSPIFQEQKRRSATGSGTRFPIRAKWWGTNLGRRRRKRSWFLYSPVCCDR